MNGSPNATGEDNAHNQAPTSSPSDDVYRGPPPEPYKVMVSLRFLVLALSSTMLLAFAVGKAARMILLEGPRRALMLSHDDSPLYDRPDFHIGYEARHAKILPPPRVPDGKPIPHTIYTAKNFDTARTATSSSLLVQRECEITGTCAAVDQLRLEEAAMTKNENDTDDEEEHLPAGQHLLVDMEFVDSSFLNSEQRLARAMVEVVNEANLTLLSYHCHALLPSGVSCVGVLLESHVSFHTWPGHGVICLDLFTCGSNPLLPVVPIIQRLFGVPRSGSGEPSVVWAHKLRGFRPPSSNPLQAWDLGTQVLGVMATDYKREIVSVETNYQRIDVYDVIYTRFKNLAQYKRSLTNDGSYESRFPALFKPERIVLLDGTLQSRSSGEHCYHESLVHPAMFTHDDPNRVAIIGGGEGATLREVLKHKTVDDVYMIEIDEIMVNVSRQYLPEWSDCSDLIGSSSWCGDDPRAHVFYEDGMKWFTERWPESGDFLEKQLDVVIVDALDPQDGIEFADALYQNEVFLKSIYNALHNDGIFVVQVGSPPETGPDMSTKHKNCAILIDNLQKAGFEAVTIYGESHSLFTMEWNYLLAFKDTTSRKGFYRNSAEMSLIMHERAVRTKSGKLPFVYFDGTTMQAYHAPSKFFEISFCLQEPIPGECQHLRGFNPGMKNVPSENMEVKQSLAGENAGRGLFAKVDIPMGAKIAVEESCHGVHIAPFTLNISMDICEAYPDEDTGVLFAYASGYGFQIATFGGKEYYVDSDFTTFINHGCNGTYNIGFPGSVNEFTADESQIADEMRGWAHYWYNPVIDRHQKQYARSSDTAIRTIKAGEEILDNYLAFSGGADVSDWKSDIKSLRDQCSGSVGEVLEYENEEEDEDN